MAFLYQAPSFRRCSWLEGGILTSFKQLKSHRTSFLSKFIKATHHGPTHPARHSCSQSQKTENNGPIMQPDNPDCLSETLHGRDEIFKTSVNGGKDAEGSIYTAECHVEVVTWRERRILASILVEASSKTVWDILTDYERLSEFIPNLICSEKMPCPYPGRIWLLQRGMQRMMYWNIEAHVVLDLEELPSLETGRELHFSMVDGDFKRYDGKWTLQAGPRPETTLLHYEVNVVPKVIFPAAFVESIIKADLPKNLSAIAKRAEAEVEVSRPSNEPMSLKDNHGNVTEELSGNANASVPDVPLSSFGVSCKLDRRCLVDEIHFRRLDDLLENGGVHRQVVATITVKAPSKVVWSVLTAYEDLPKFVPNLTSSMVLSRGDKTVCLLQEGCKCLLYMALHARVVLDLLEQPEERISFKQVEGDFDTFQGNWVLKQFGSQHTVLTYTVDTKIRRDCILAESLVEEFIYEDLPSNLCAIRDRVETLANSSSVTPPLASPEASHSPSLSASQTANTNGSFAFGKLETGASAVNGLDSPDSLNMGPQKKSRKRRACIKGLMDDYRVLEAEVKEFIRAHGVEGMMPMRKHFRQHSRSDLEKAVRAMGGFGTIAARMKLSLSYKERKPLGYWDDLENLRNEVIAAQKALGCDSRVLPSRLSIERAGSYSLARALEKWGGAKETARILGLKTKRLQKKEHRTGKGPVKRSVPDSIIMCEPALVNSATLGADPKAEVEKEMMRDAMAEDEGELSPLGDLPTDPSMITEAPNHPLLEHEASSSLSSLPEQYQDGKATMSYASASGKETSQSSVNESKHAHNNQAKDKRMPYKTGVPQESSKWLTLCTDIGLLDVADESQVYRVVVHSQEKVE